MNLNCRNKQVRIQVFITLRNEMKPLGWMLTAANFLLPLPLGAGSNSPSLCGRSEIYLPLSTSGVIWTLVTCTTNEMQKKCDIVNHARPSGNQTPCKKSTRGHQAPLKPALHM